MVERLQSSLSSGGALVVPVFDDGRCFYQTTQPFFKDRNPEGAQDEQALRATLRAAKKAGIPVYLGLDLLAWQRTRTGTPSSLFTRHPELEELNQYVVPAALPEARYASPSHATTRGALSNLISELATRFPEAAGIVLDARYGEREIYGFNAMARASYARRHQLDPADFGLDNIAGLKVNPTLRSWIDWKRQTLTELASSLATQYRKLQPEDRILVSGYAEYYTNREFHDIRTAQDWLGWLSTGRFDGVLLEGRWLAPFPDIDQLAPLKNRVAALSQRLGKPLSFVPLSTGGHLIHSADYSQEAAVIRGRMEKLPGHGLLVRQDADLLQVQQFWNTPVESLPAGQLTVGAPLPDFRLPRADSRAEWGSKSLRGKQSMALVALDGTQPPGVLPRALRSWVDAGIEPVVLTRTMPTGTAPEAVTLLDPRGEVLSRFPPGVDVILVDRAGFVRQTGSLAGDEAALQPFFASPDQPGQPNLVLGKAAPEFAIPDATGQTVRLRDYRGKKHVLLTFFPKCFTDG